MTINQDELKALLAAQKKARAAVSVVYDDEPKTKPVKDIETSVMDYAERIARVRARGGLGGGGDVFSEIGECDSCPDCGGSGALGYNVPYGHPDFGKSYPCPNPIHADDRLRYLGSVGLLFDEDAKINLYDLAEYHDESSQVAVDGSKIMRASSNVKMLDRFKAIVADPKRNPLTYVLGPNGNGKTTAAKGLVNAINKASKGPAIYITLVDLIAYVKEAYDRGVGETSEARFRKIAHSRVIVVDEFEIGTGKVMATEHNYEFLFRWFSERYAAAKNGTGITVLISNQNPSRIASEAVRSRLKDYERVANTAPDFRGAETWQF